MASRQIAIRIVVQSENSAANIDKVNDSLGRLNREKEKSTHLQNGLTNSFIKGNLAARAISTAYLTVRDSMRAVLSEVITFDFEMAKISAILEVTGEQFDRLDASIRHVAVANRLGHTELAKTALEMGKVGLSAQEVQNSIEGVARLSRALDENLVTTGETVASVIRAYGFEAAEANRITEQLAYTVKASALDIESFRVAFSYVGGTAKMAGVSFEELQASMQVLSNSGIRASTIGTQLRKVILTLSNDASLASKVLGGRTLQDFDSLTDALAALGDAGLQAHDYFKLFGATAASVAPILVRQAEIIQKQKENTEEANKALGRMADRINDTYSGSVTNFTGAIKDLGIELGEIPKPLVIGFFDGIAESVKQNTTGLKVFVEYLKQVNAYRFRYTAPVMPAMPSFATARNSVYGNLPQQGDAALVANMDKTLKGLLNTTQAYALAKKNLNNEKSFASLIAVDPQKAQQLNDIAEAAKRLGLGLEFANALLAAKGQLEEETRNALSEQAQESAIERIDRESEALKERNKLIKEYTDFWIKINQDNPSNFGIDASLTGAGKTDTWAGWDTPVGLLPKQNKSEESDEGKDARKALRDYNTDASNAMKEFNVTQLATLELLKQVDAAAGQVGYQFGESMVSALTGGGNAFKEFNTLFGDIAKHIIASITAMIVKMLVFRTIMMALGLAPVGALGFNPTGSFFKDAMLSSMGGQVKTNATGGDTMVNQPTWFLAGEEGPENVRVTPRAKSSSQGGGGITVVIQGDVMDGNKFQEAIELAERRMNRRYV